MKHRIKELIAERGYTQKEFAELLGVDRITVNRVMNGQPSMATMDKVLDLLHAEPWELFYTREELIDLAYRETKKLTT
jgi:transcriptional regulator with XRE-family HTH domain